MTRDELEVVFHETILAAAAEKVPPSRAVDILLAAASEYAAGQVEKHARTPRSQQGPGRRRERGEGRKSA